MCWDDVAYIDLRFGSNVYHVTAMHSGYCIIRSMNVKFDPRPKLGTEGYYSHSLLYFILLFCVIFIAINPIVTFYNVLLFKLIK